MDDQCAGAGGGDSYAWLARPAWLAGCAASAAALLAQALLLLLVPRCRQYDEKILLQLTIARLSNSVSEYMATEPRGRHDSAANLECNFFFAVYTDFALVCFMLVFSKNLYDRVVVVFAGAKWGAGWAGGAVWAAAAPPAALCVLLLHYRLYEAFRVYYKVYVSAKFLVLITNAGLFVRILSVVCARKAPARVAAVACALVVLTSLQALLSDLLTVFCSGHHALTNAFYAINAFQGVHVLAIVVLIARGRVRRARDVRLRSRDVRLRATAAGQGSAAPHTDLVTDSTDDKNMML